MMIAKMHPCDPNKLTQLLDDQLSETDTQRLTDHLSSCSICREQLKTLAGADDWWISAREILSDSTLGPAGQVDEREFDSPDETAAWLRCLLQPTSTENSIGRFGGYEISGCVGQGGMGIVLRGQDNELCRPVAIKILYPHLAGNGAARKRFLREAQAAAAVVHPNVVPIYAVDTESKLPFLVMPFISGGNLQQRVDDEGPLELDELLRIGVQIAEGLAAAHRHGLVHRDIKPANVLLEGGNGRVLISDFGLARALDDATLTASGTLAGTPQFMSPEQAAGETVDASSDLFSLGSVLYTLATGRPPYRGDTTLGILKQIGNVRPKAICEINERMPAWLDQIVAKLMSVQRKGRGESADTVAWELQQCLAHVRAPSRNSLPHDLSRAQRNRSFMTVLGLAIFAALIGLTVMQSPNVNEQKTNSNASEEIVHQPPVVSGKNEVGAMPPRTNSSSVVADTARDALDPAQAARSIFGAQVSVEYVPTDTQEHVWNLDSVLYDDLEDELREMRQSLSRLEQ